MSNEIAITNDVLAIRGIDEVTWSALKNSIYPGAKDESVMMAVDYCRARQLDPLLKPVHLVPMSVKDSKSGRNEWRDVVMPGIGLYRIQADRSGDYAGANEPEFGPDVTQTLSGVEVTFPQWCKYTVSKRMASGEIVEFSAKEYWIENYATGGRDTSAPNAMWKKRPYAQLAKCAEAQALRKAWPFDSRSTARFSTSIAAGVTATTFEA
jgi:phage recombination protein Bet